MGGGEWRFHVCVVVAEVESVLPSLQFHYRLHPLVIVPSFNINGKQGKKNKNIQNHGQPTARVSNKSRFTFIDSEDTLSVAFFFFLVVSILPFRFLVVLLLLQSSRFLFFSFFFFFFSSPSLFPLHIFQPLDWTNSWNCPVSGLGDPHRSRPSCFTPAWYDGNDTLDQWEKHGQTCFDGSIPTHTSLLLPQQTSLVGPTGRIAACAVSRVDGVESSDK